MTKVCIPSKRWNVISVHFIEYSFSCKKIERKKACNKQLSHLLWLCLAMSLAFIAFRQIASLYISQMFDEVWFHSSVNCFRKITSPSSGSFATVTILNYFKSTLNAMCKHLLHTSTIFIVVVQFIELNRFTQSFTFRIVLFVIINIDSLRRTFYSWLHESLLFTCIVRHEQRNILCFRYFCRWTLVYRIG